jgi:hypothetical protein
MKTPFVLSMLIPLAMVCSCQKQDATAEQQLAQRKMELDARENALDGREKALAERERALARAPMRPADVQLRALQRDGSAGKAGPAPSIPPGLMPSADAAGFKAERERRIQERIAQRQRRLEEIQKMRSIGAQANPAGGASNDTSASASTSGSADTSASGSTGENATSPTPSPTPQ